jgi:signal transduction histidine kinase
VLPDVASGAALRHAFMMEEITSVLRHDVRNHLAAIRNAGFFLRRKLETTAPALVAEARVAQMLELIASEAVAIEAMLSRLRPPPAAPGADARAVAARVATTANGVSAEPGGPAAVRADADELALAVACLVDNALDSAGAATVRCGADGDRVVIEVVDDGPGFADGAEGHALDPFFTTKAGRLGLGLNIARRIAARAGGTLSLAARAPCGVSARLVLPGAQ